MNTQINLEDINESTYPVKITLEKSIPICYRKCNRTDFTNKFKNMEECVCNLKRSLC